MHTHTHTRARMLTASTRDPRGCGGRVVLTGGGPTRQNLAGLQWYRDRTKVVLFVNGGLPRWLQSVSYLCKAPPVSRKIVVFQRLRGLHTAILVTSHTQDTLHVKHTNTHAHTHTRTHTHTCTHTYTHTCSYTAEYTYHILCHGHVS